MVSLASGEGFDDTWHCSVLVFFVYILLYSALKLVSGKYPVNFLTVVCVLRILVVKAILDPGKRAVISFALVFPLQVATSPGCALCSAEGRNRSEDVCAKSARLCRVSIRCSPCKG